MESMNFAPRHLDSIHEGQVRNPGAGVLTQGW
jgi:hypothetical protein